MWVGFSRGESATGVSVSWDPRRSGAGSDVLQLEIEALDAESAPVGELRRLNAARTSEPAGTNGDAATRDGPTAAARSGPLVSRFELPPGGMTLRFTARDGEGDAVDRWTKKVIVPEFDGGVALASLRFLRALTALEYRALRSADAPAPTSLRQFRRTDRVLVETECYAPDGAGIEVTAQLLNQSGQQLTTFTPAVDERRRVRVELPLTNLAAATYILRVRAGSGDNVTEQLEAFKLVP